MFPSKASTVAARSVAVAGHNERFGRQGRLDGAPFVFGQCRPERDSGAYDLGRIAAGVDSLADGSACLGDHRVDRPSERPDIVGQSLAIGTGWQRLDIQPERGNRCAESVAQIGDGLPLGVQEVDDPSGQSVERDGDRSGLRWSGRGDAGVEVAAGEPARRVGHRLDRVGRTSAPGCPLRRWRAGAGRTPDPGARGGLGAPLR